MKRCPQCNRIYNDETLNYCLDDGEWLETDGQVGNESATVLLPSSSRPTSSSRSEYIITGIKRHRLVAVIVLIALVLTGVGLFAYLQGNKSEAAIESIAVLPLVNQSRDPDTE